MQLVLRDCIHAAGRMLTHRLPHPRWRDRGSVSWTYVQLYRLGKRLTDQAKLTALQALIKPGMVIADIGANLGFYAIRSAPNVGPSGRILAFEPDAFSFGLLQSRIKRTGVNNVEPFQLALGDKTGRAVLYCITYNRADNRLSNRTDNRMLEQARSRFSPWMSSCLHRASRARPIKDRCARP